MINTAFENSRYCLDRKSVCCSLFLTCQTGPACFVNIRSAVAVRIVLWDAKNTRKTWQKCPKEVTSGLVLQDISVFSGCWKYIIWHLDIWHQVNSQEHVRRRETEWHRYKHIVTKSDAKRCKSWHWRRYVTWPLASDAAKIWIRFQCEFPTIIADSFNTYIGAVWKFL